MPDALYWGEVMYVPGGTAVEEREKLPEAYTWDICQEYPQDLLHLTVDVSLPYHVIEGPEHWVLLADWFVNVGHFEEEDTVIHWMIRREDLAVRRFNRMNVIMDWSP